MKEIVKSTRGTVHQYNDDSLDFKPYGKGEPVYEHSYKVGEAQIGLTKGKGKQSFVAKLKCDTTEADPCEVMHQQLDKLAKKEWPDRDKTDDKPRGKVLLKEDGAYMAVDTRKGQISIHLDIDLSETCDYGQRIANFIIKTNQCLYINQDLVRRAARATAKPSNK